MRAAWSATIAIVRERPERIATGASDISPPDHEVKDAAPEDFEHAADDKTPAPKSLKVSQAMICLVWSSAVKDSPR